MMRSRQGLVGLGALAVVALIMHPAIAVAQGQSGRPYRGLFGSGAGDADQTLTSSLSASLGEEDVSATVGAVGPERSARSSSNILTSGNWSGDLVYSLGKSRVSVTARGVAYSRFSPSARETSPISRMGSAVVGWRALKHTDVQLSMQTARQPLAATSFFPGLPAGALDNAVLADYVLGDAARGLLVSDTVDIRLDQQITQRSSLSFGGGYERTVLSEASKRNVQSATAAYSQRLTRSLSLRIGFLQSVGRYGSADDGHQVRFRNQTIDGGLDYSGQLSLSRHSTLQFRTGSAMMSDRQLRRFRLTGSAAYRYELGRTWDATAAYDRQVGFLQSVLAPAFTDSLTGAVSGLLSRRLRVQSSFGIATGGVGLQEAPSGYSAVFGGASVATGVSRFLNVRVDYSYYRYHSEAAELLPDGPGFVSRQSLSIGAQVFAPLFTRVRRGNAAR
jgi:hypothetical protein